MHVKTLKPFVFFVAVTVMASLACSLVTGSGAPAPADPAAERTPEQQSSEQQASAVDSPPVQEEPQSSGNGDSHFILFTDQNDLYSIEVPADWNYEQTLDTETNYYSIDSFTSPDGGAIFEKGWFICSIMF